MCVCVKGCKSIGSIIEGNEWRLGKKEDVPDVPTIFYSLRNEHHVRHLKGQFVWLLGSVGSDHFHLHGV